MRILAFLVVRGAKSALFSPVSPHPKYSGTQVLNNFRVPRGCHVDCSSDKDSQAVTHIQITGPYPSFSTARKKNRSYLSLLLESA